MKLRTQSLVCGVLFCCYFSNAIISRADDASKTGTSATADAGPRFETDVRLILKKHCWHCHGEEEHPEGGLDLRLVRLMLQGGDSGAAVAVGDVEGSLLLQRVKAGEMPPDEGKLLSPEEVDVLERWIAAGAKTVRPEPDDLNELEFITEEEKSHWAFQPVRRPPVPVSAASEVAKTPVDHFLLRKLQTEGFGFAAPARPHTLLRRLYLDLHGLPPTPQGLQRFVNDQRPDRVAREVDRLLASPRYGERWARHWLDVAGYADSEGYNDADTERAHAWRYRDYVIEAFNSDMPFNQFIREQLAGDELITSPLNSLSPEDARLLAATGFLRMAPDGTGGSVPDAMVARNDTIADTIRIVSSSLMGMTVGCAQCHDHRYDPISQADYYRFRAIFEPAFDWQKWRNPNQRKVSLYTDADRAVAAEIEVKAKAVEAERSKKQQEYIQATFEKQLAKLPEELHAAAREAHQSPAAKRTAEQKALLQKHPSLNVSAGSLYLYDRKAADELAELAEQAKEIRKQKPSEGFVRALTEVSGRVPPMHLFHRGDHQQPKQQLEPGGLTVVSEVASVPEIAPTDPELTSSGRRLALARRLTDPAYPLTARAIVNRIWMHHFGRGLVTSVSDFGVLGQQPTHPELLDWLAAEFIESGWSLKHLHRLILNSAAWQQQLRSNDQLAQADPDNEWYGGSRLRRLDAEVVRDSMLQICGRLNLKSGGPPVPVMADRVGRFVIGKENSNAGRPGKEINMNGEEFRRSIFVQVRRSRPLSVLHTFDRPVMTPNCDRRRPSTNATQSLLMINSDMVIEYSRYLADRLLKETDLVPQQVDRAWRLVFLREPEHSEREQAIRFVQDEVELFLQQPAYSSSEAKKQDKATREALSVLSQMLFSSNEFLYVD